MHLQFIVEVNFHGLSLRIARILIEMALLVALRRYRARLEVSLLLVQFLHVVRVRRLWQQHDLFVGVARVARDELGRRLVAVHRAASLPLRIVRISRHHGVQLLALNICHAVDLLVKLLGPFLLVLDDLLTRITIHVRFRVTEAQNLLVGLLILILCHHVIAIVFKILRWLLVTIQRIFLQFIDVLKIEALRRLDAESVLTVLETGLLLLLLNLNLFLQKLRYLRILHQLLQLVHRDVVAADVFLILLH